MTISYQNSKGKAVVLKKTGEKIGFCQDLIIELETGKFLGIILENKKAILASDLQDFRENTFFIDHRNRVVSLKKIDKAIKIVGLRVVTEAGNYLGKVRDFEVELEGANLKTIVVRTSPLKMFLQGELVITPEQIISISKDMIVVSDLVEKIYRQEMIKSKSPAI